MNNFPVIGICGPAGSGKDFVANWFCEKKDFIKVAFADPMKRFVRATFQVDYESLWGETEKREKPITFSESEMGDIAGRISVKANELLINEVVTDNRVQAYMSLTEWFASMKQSHDKQGHLTMREVLQTLGTEWGRRKVDPLLWVNYLYEKVAFHLAEGGWSYSQENGLAPSNTKGPEGIIIPDHRFLNEIHGTRKFGGYSVRLRRLAKEKEWSTSNVGIENHQSEVEMRDIPDSEFDRVLELGEGAKNVYPVLEKLFEEKPWTKKTPPSQTEEASTTSSPEGEPPSSTA